MSGNEFQAPHNQITAKSDSPDFESDPTGDEKEEGYFANYREVWALGIAIVIGGQYFSWNSGLNAGFGNFAITTLLIGSAYGCFSMSLSEISSTLPFAGSCVAFLLDLG